MNRLTEQQLGEAFRELRELSRMSLADVAKRAGLKSKSIVWRLEHGSIPSVTTQSAIARAMNVKLYRLYRRAERNVPACGTNVAIGDTKAL